MSETDDGVISALDDKHGVLPWCEPCGDLDDEEFDEDFDEDFEDEDDDDDEWDDDEDDEWDEDDEDD